MALLTCTHCGAAHHGQYGSLCEDCWAEHVAERLHSSARPQLRREAIGRFLRGIAAHESRSEGQKAGKRKVDVE